MYTIKELENEIKSMENDEYINYRDMMEDAKCRETISPEEENIDKIVRTHRWGYENGKNITAEEEELKEIIEKNRIL